MDRADRARPEEGGQAPSPATAEEIAARIAVLTRLVDTDPVRLNDMLDADGAGFWPRMRLSPHLPSTLALLDELETLVALLAERRDMAAAELRHDRRRRQALGAYRTRRAEA